MVYFDPLKEHYIQVGIVSDGTCQSSFDLSIFVRLEDHDTHEFITKQFWDNVPTSSTKTIEKLFAENKELRGKMEEMIRKNDLMYNSLEALNIRLSSCLKTSYENKVIDTINSYVGKLKIH